MLIDKKVSVIFIINDEIDITKAINSIQNQSYPYIEIIVINETNREINIPDVKIIKNTDVDSIDLAIFESTGDYITFHKLNEYSHETRIETQLIDLLNKKSQMSFCKSYNFKGSFDFQKLNKTIIQTKLNLNTCIFDKEIFNDCKLKSKNIADYILYFYCNLNKKNPELVNIHQQILFNLSDCFSMNSQLLHYSCDFQEIPLNKEIINNLIQFPLKRLINKKVSIIVYSYNKECFVINCLKSLLNQSYKNIEIIVIDDCSTDRSFEIIENFSKDKNINIFRNEINIGETKSRNKGIELSSGDYITFHDINCYSITKRIETQMNELYLDNFKISICSDHSIHCKDQDVDDIIERIDYDFLVSPKKIGRSANVTTIFDKSLFQEYNCSFNEENEMNTLVEKFYCYENDLEYLDNRKFRERITNCYNKTICFSRDKLYVHIKIIK